MRSALVLQLRIDTRLPMSDGCEGLMFSSPARPGEDEGGRPGMTEEELGDQPQNFGGGAKLGERQGHAASVSSTGLVSFRLPNALRRCSAPSLARKAAAAMTKLMCRCQPCQDRASQWSRPRSSLALRKHSSMVQRSPAAAASSANVVSMGAWAK